MPSVRDLTDEELAEAYVERDDERAFSALVARHQDKIFGYLVGMVKDRSIAADLFQETFLRIVQAMRKERGGYVSQGRWLGWAMRIARNAALDHLRSRKKWSDVESKYDDDGPSFWDRLAAEEPSAADQLHHIEVTDELEKLIDRLPPEQREVVLFRHRSELTFREIAELTDVSINTALGRMRYALINLRKMMDPEFKPPPSHVPRRRSSQEVAGEDGKE